MSRKDISDKQVCEAYAEAALQRGPNWDHPYEMPYEILHRLTGEPEKVCYRAMERAEERCYIEYGVSLRTGWLTDKGKELLTSK
jgi:hypothetical protein